MRDDGRTHEQRHHTGLKLVFMNESTIEMIETRQREQQEEERKREEAEQIREEINDRALANRRIEAARDAIRNQNLISEQETEIERLKAETAANKQSIEELVACLDDKDQQIRKAKR